MVLTAACGQSGDELAEQSRQQPSENLLLVIVDDISMTAMGCYGNEYAAETPTLDSIADRGVRFDTVWSNPMCSPTRATLLTGRYSFRTGVGRVVKRKSTSGGLQLSEVTLPEALKNEPSLALLRTAFIGKWHLSTMADWPEHVTEQGFDRFRGTFGNISNATKPEKYFEYEEWVDGRSATRKQYATSATVDDVLAAAQDFGEAPWFITASFHAAHLPLHRPPPSLTGELGEDPSNTELYLAMVEALDVEMGRMLAGLGDDVLARTHVVVVSDNGLSKGILRDPNELFRGKGTVSENGVRVPLMIMGPGIVEPGRASHALVNTTDVFATCVELMGGAAPQLAEDSVSVVPILRNPAVQSLRDWIFTERFYSFEKNGVPTNADMLAVRGRRYKRQETRQQGISKLFDLEADPLEERDLMQAGELSNEASSAYETLGSVLETSLSGR